MYINSQFFSSDISILRGGCLSTFPLLQMPESGSHVDKYSESRLQDRSPSGYSKILENWSFYKKMALLGSGVKASDELLPSLFVLHYISPAIDRCKFEGYLRQFEVCPMNHVLTYVLGGIALAVTLLGCAAVKPPPPGIPAEKATPVLKPGDILDSRDGEVISFETLMSRLDHVQVVYAGEMHTSVEDHRIQLHILKALFSRNPSVMLAMEMFPRDEQAVLDRFSRGKISEQSFIKEAKWEKVWGYPYGLYRDILEFARNRNIRIIGLNAPPSIVGKIARSGLSSLTAKERSRVAAHFHLDDPIHRDYVKKEYEQHLKGDIKGFDSFFEAQLAWEDTMSETLARLLSTFKDNEQVMVMIGAGHISDGMGVPKLTADRINYSYRTIVPIPIDELDPRKDLKTADFIWITEPSEHFRHGKVGIMLRPLPSKEGLEVVGVLPGSTAEKIGFKKGDILYMVDGTAIGTIEDLHGALRPGMPVHRLTVKRDGETVALTVSDWR
jgi:uncharacterized iron-regulated protein